MFVYGIGCTLGLATSKNCGLSFAPISHLFLRIRMYAFKHFIMRLENRPLTTTYLCLGFDTTICSFCISIVRVILANLVVLEYGPMRWEKWILFLFPKTFTRIAMDNDNKTKRFSVVLFGILFYPPKKATKTSH